MKLCIYCAGGYGKEVYDCAIRINNITSKWEKIIFVDDTIPNSEPIYSTVNISFDDIVKGEDKSNIKFIIANGEPLVRKTLFNKIESFGFNYDSIVDPSATVSPTASLSDGVVVGPYAFVSSSVFIDKNVAINVGGIIGHDIIIGMNTVVSSYVNIGGASEIGSNTYLGMGAMVKERINIGKNTIIGMGSVVYSDIPDGVIALGNPARPMRKNDGKKVFK